MINTLIYSSLLRLQKVGKEPAANALLCEHDSPFTFFAQFKVKSACFSNFFSTFARC